MAVLSNGERATLWAGIMSKLSSLREPIGVSKIDGRAAINAVDQWINDNTASFNAAIPEPARSALTIGQKLRMLKVVINRRWEVL